ncbi:MAG TPA: penicillin-binding transpeptidase domain-containing protein [Kofleriaceae bacterium]|nr:penicillin-binding transpeptidase domain-containing protein [Kofleriaceae bacterium]
MSSRLPSRRRWMLGLSALALGSASVHQRTPVGGGDVDWRYLPSVRGEILDRNGLPFADSRGAFNLYVLPRLYGAEVRSSLIELLDLDAAEVEELDRRAAASDDPAGRRAVLVLENVGRRRAGIADDARRRLAGAVEVHLESRRRYPQGELAAHLVGYASPANPRELAELAMPGDTAELVGRHGLEESLESWLHGEPGIERFAIGSEGERAPASALEAMTDRPAFEPPVAGHDLVLTVDLELQRAARDAVRDHPAAAVVVTEVETGRILALVSRPTFDPNAMIAPDARQELRLESDPLRPLVDRTVAPYPPGSTFKLATAVAALESGTATRDEEHTCTGSRLVGKSVYFDMGVHGTVDFVQALQVSCNVYFWAVAERVGLDAIARAARDLGFGARSGLGINGDSAGLVPDRTTRDLEGPGRLGYIFRTAIGNGDVRVTAVQLAMAYGAIANGGRLFEPRIVRRIQTASGELVEDRPPVLRRRVEISPDTLEILREGTWRAVNVAGGTGHAARQGAIPMAGKTGTALTPSDDAGDSHAWFVGWAPADRPELLVVVFIEHGGVGGKVAAPIARAVIDRSVSILERQRRKARPSRRRR